MYDNYEPETTDQNETDIISKIIKYSLYGLSTLLFLIIFKFWVIVPAGHVGVVLNLGAVQPEVMKEGMHLKAPIVQKIIKMDCRVKKTETEASAASKDLQTVYSKIAVNYHIIPEAASQLYQKVGTDYNSKIIAPAVQESIKAATANYTAEQLVTKRDEVSVKTKDLLNTKLQPYNIVVDRFNIVNFQFSETFSNAVEAKQTAEQQALKASYDLKRIEVEANQKIAQAKAEAEALRLQKQEITPELIQLRQIEAQKLAIDKWNGQLPTYSGGGAVPFINVK